MSTSSNSSFEMLKKFLESKPASQKAIKHLRNGAEIGVIIGHKVQCTYFKENNKPKFEKRPAQKPDVIFYIKPETINILCSNPGEDVGDFGIVLFKEYMAGGLRVRKVGSALSISRNGYLKIIRSGSPTYAKFLANYGAHGFVKAFDAIKNYRKRSAA